MHQPRPASDPMTQHSHLDHAELLSRIGMFAELDRVILAKLANHLEPQTFTAGALFFREGDPGESMYLIVRGTVGGYVAGVEGRDVRLFTLGRSEAFGEMALLTTNPRSATVRAETDCEVMRLGRTKFLELVRQQPGVALAVAATLSRRLTSVVTRAAAAGHDDALQRTTDGDGDDAAEEAPEQRSAAKAPPRPWLKPLALWGPLGFALAVLLLAAVVPPPEGLSPAGWKALAILIAAVPAIAVQVIPEGVLALLLAMAYAVLGAASPGVALSGYATQSWVLLVCVLAIGGALASTGLLYRLALLTIARMKGGFAGQVLSLTLAGVLIGPAVPNATARVIIIAPMLRELVEALGYDPRSRGAVGLAMAALMGFGQLAAVFLTSSTTGVLVFAILQGQQGGMPIDWMTWAWYGAPANILLFVGLVGAILLLYRDPARKASAPRSVSRSLALQLALLGPPSRNEKIALAVGVLMLLGFVGQPLHGVHPSWVAVLALAALAIAGIATANTLQGANWSFALLFGVLAGIATIFAETGLDAWLTAAVGNSIGDLGASPVLFVAALTLLCFAVSLIVRWQAASPLITIALAPVAAAAGIDPYVVGLISVIACNGFFLSYQSTTYLALYHGTEGQLFSHLQALPMAIAYAVVTLLALCASVPVWHAMGLL